MYRGRKVIGKVVSLVFKLEKVSTKKFLGGN